MTDNRNHATLGTDQGRALLRLARRTLAESFNLKLPADPDLEKALKDPQLQEKRATFVTLTLNKNLRGCIGSLCADETLISGVVCNVKHAAFHDCRFSPLSLDELDQVAIEVSILTDPQPLDYKDSDELLARLRPNIDGVILRKGRAGATFLPQVWEHLPEASDFLSQLCCKACLAPDAWRKENLTVLTYQVQYFHE